MRAGHSVPPSATTCNPKLDTRSAAHSCRVDRRRPPVHAVGHRPLQPPVHACSRQPRQPPVNAVGRKPVSEADRQHAVRLVTDRQHVGVMPITYGSAARQLLGPPHRSGACARRTISRSGRATRGCCGAGLPRSARRARSSSGRTSSRRSATRSSARRCCSTSSCPLSFATPRPCRSKPSPGCSSSKGRSLLPPTCGRRRCAACRGTAGATPTIHTLPPYVPYQQKLPPCATLCVRGCCPVCAAEQGLSLCGCSPCARYLADRLLASSMAVYTFALGIVFWGAHSSPTQRAIAAASLGGLVPLVLSQHSLRLGQHCQDGASRRASRLQLS